MKLFAEMGFDAVFMARIDMDDKLKRAKDKTLEFIWTPEGSDAEIFAHVLWHHYSSPEGFKFDVLDANRQRWTNYISGVANRRRAELMLYKVAERREHYGTNHIVMVFGDDF